MSMKNSRWNLRSVTVSMVVKSQATAAWDRRNCDQVTSERVGAGSIRALLRISPDRGRSEAVAEPSQFAVDAAVSPGWILGCEAQCESANLC